MEPRKIKQRYEALKSERKTLEQTLQQIEQLVVPFRGKFFREQTSEHEVSWRQVQLYDTTAIQACDMLASSMQGSLTSPAYKWFGLRFNKDKLNAMVDPMIWLESAEEKIFYALQESNFNIEASEFYIDLCSFGTSIIAEEEINEEAAGWYGIDFQTIPMRDCFFEPDHKGRVLRFYRRLQWTPLQIVDKFGRENTPDDILEKLDARAVNEKIEIIFCIFERSNYRTADVSGVLAPLKRPFGYRYVLHRDATQLGKEGGYYEMPSFIARWRKVSGSQWGHSPAHICLADVLNINELVEATLEAAGKAVDPPNLTTNRGLLTDLDLGRGGLTVLRNIGDLVPYDGKARFDVADSVYELFQRSIRQTFRVDQLQLKESPAMTATEVQARYEIMQRLLGPTLGRLQNDFLDPVISRTFNILLRSGELGEIPDVVREEQGQLKVEYTGPLPRAQRMDTVNSMTNWMMGLGQLSELFPELRDLPNVDEYGRMSARLMSVPALAVNSRETVEALREQRAEQQQQMIESAQEKMDSETGETDANAELALAKAGQADRAA